MPKWFLDLFSTGNPGTGALPETRSESDITFKEIVASANAVEWQEKSLDSLRSFPDRDQHYTNSCVANTLAKQMGILHYLKNGHFIPFSASDIYRRRSNRPGGGMFGSDAYDIAARGVTLEAVLPSDQLRDPDVDALHPEPYAEDVGKIFALEAKRIVLTSEQVGDIDILASIIQTTGKGVMVWFYFKDEEWSPETPEVRYPGLNAFFPSTLRHSVTAVDYFLRDGVKTLKIEDSAHFGGRTVRYITEDFFKARNWYGAYPMHFRFDATMDKPVYTETVVSLQDCLKYEGVFPANIESTGYFGSITRTAVMDFQEKHGLERVGNVGPKTTALLKKLYGA